MTALGLAEAGIQTVMLGTFRWGLTARLIEILGIVMALGDVANG